MKTKQIFLSTKFNVTIYKFISFHNTLFAFLLLLFFAISTGSAVSQAVTEPIIRLQVSCNNISDETVLFFKDNASEGLDYNDSPKMMNNNDLIPEIYTMIGIEEFAINTMPALTADKDITLAFKTGSAGTFKIINNEFSNFPAGTTVKLINNINKEEQIISDGSVYTFTSEAITKIDMFTVRIDLPEIIVVDPEPIQKITFSVNENNRILVTCNEVIVKGATLLVNSLAGKIEFQGKLTNTITLVNKKLNAGTYIVTVKNGGIVTSGKVIISNR